MKRTLKLFGPAAVTLALMCLPVLALAAGDPTIGGGAGDPTVGGGAGTPTVGGGAGSPTVGGGTPVVPVAPAAQNTYTPQQVTCNGNACTLQNPLQVTSICSLLKLLLNSLMIIGLPIAVVFLVLVGFQFIIAQGDPGKIGKARENLKYTVIGIAVFLGSWTVVEIAKATFQSLGVTGFGSC